MTTFIEQKFEGLKLRFSNKPNKKSQIEFTLKIEKLVSNYRYASYKNKTEMEQIQEQLLNVLDRVIKKKAESWERRWNNKGLGTSEFESVFYETLWKLCDSYNWYSNFYFYETLCLALDRKAKTVTKKATLTNKGKFENDVLPLFDSVPCDINIENDVINRHLIEQGDILTLPEKQLLKTLYENHDASFRELANLIGLKHPEQVKRNLKKIAKKIFLE